MLLDSSPMPMDYEYQDENLLTGFMGSEQMRQKEL